MIPEGQEYNPFPKGHGPGKSCHESQRTAVGRVLADTRIDFPDQHYINARLDTHDRHRIELMKFIIQSRERRLETLDDEQWDRVFR